MRGQECSAGLRSKHCLPSMCLRLAATAPNACRNSGILHACTCLRSGLHIAGLLSVPKQQSLDPTFRQFWATSLPGLHQGLALEGSV